MQGIPMDTVLRLRKPTKKQMIVAGGIATVEEIQQLDDLKVDAVVGMAIYTGKLKLTTATIASTDRRSDRKRDVL